MGSFGVMFCLIWRTFKCTKFLNELVSDEIFGSETSVGRRLLQTKKACPVSFEFLNYTIITSKCKGPLYSPKLCCSALTELSCPYVDVMNDMTTLCASTMFSYINLHGKYPPGLFSSICREGDQGLACPQLPAPSHPNSTPLSKRPSPAIIVASGLVLLFSWPFFTLRATHFCRSSC
ncbi:GPI-anchored protein LLG1-like isoform X3 [Cucurbita pepo subsp. pepo]|uniref:GPI-anchored protein LLG1-like isoform X3 n=1 Tax=Cucurbita pepo subsp. pepo TaxID=3664 RepID=UPI000C9D7D3E|nr:GPI-anchored protein LLG1-like isoform X3 [Cucurbita pepo subsp. pepo]